MPYEDSTAVEEPPADKSATEERDDTFFIPPDMIQNADRLKPGDKLTFTFLGRDKDGHLEVENDKPVEDDGEDMLNEMRGVEAKANAASSQGEY